MHRRTTKAMGPSGAAEGAVAADHDEGDQRRELAELVGSLLAERWLTRCGSEEVDRRKKTESSRVT